MLLVHYFVMRELSRPFRCDHNSLLIEFIARWMVMIMSMAYYNCMALCKLMIENKTCQLFESWMLKGIKLSRNLLVRVLGVL